MQSQSSKDMRRSRWLLGVCVAAASGLAAWSAAAHTTERGFIMLLPTEYYLIGGALAVAASFLLLVLAPGQSLAAAFRARLVRRLPSPALETAISCLSFVLFLILLGAGLRGTRDPLANPLPLAIWTLWWVGFPLATALFGDLWRALNPWTGPYRSLLGLAGMRDEGARPLLRLPESLGYWPAIAGFFAFVWFELIDLAPDDPERLALAAAGYWSVNFVALLLFGEAAWLQRGECFSVFFRLVALLAPISARRSEKCVETVIALPAARLVEAPALPMSGVLFVLLTLASVSFDGLNKTFWWLALNGINPLEFPGRSAMIETNTLGLVAAWAILASMFLVVVLSGWLLAGRTDPPLACVGRLVLTIMPIALAYHFAHYLTLLLVNGQYALAAASDPFGTGADLLGLGVFHVTTSFLTTYDSVAVIWRVQAGAIVLGHVMAVIAAHLIALDIHDGSRRAALSQVPLTCFMILYTLFGLWLLATPTGA